MASLEKQNLKKKTSSRAKKCSSLQKHDSNPGSSGNMSNGEAKVSKKSTYKRKKAFPNLRGSYSLRSLDSGRILRSRPNIAKCSSSLDPASNPGNFVPSAKKRGKKKVKKSDQDELSKIKRHIRYMLNRMNYEQSFIDAYSGEGWKGQSAEKIRPEKELGRAKSEILRFKSKIREIFQHLDSLLAEGRLQESLFDPDGIDSENIFCANCGSKEVLSDNDIILCDGVCVRGFHQKCLNPPLLSDDIPSGEEGWLCPQCDCKSECIDLLSEFLGKDLSIEDSWNKFFPEAAALGNGNGQYEDLNLPSDDSEDDDYNPEAQDVDVGEQEEGPSYNSSDSSSSLCDSTSSDDNVGQATVDCSTDESEDEDYDPDARDPDKEIQISKSSSDGSDFTSDSDEFCAELSKNTYADETSASTPPNLKSVIDSGRDNINDEDRPLDYSKLPSPMAAEDEQVNGLRSTNKRDRSRLDYKRLYDEAYGKSSSDSSDDEDWNEMSTPKKMMKIDSEECEEDAVHSAVKPTQELQRSMSSISASPKGHAPQERHASGCSSPRHQRKLGIASKILHEAFQENQYPTTEKKKSLAQELGTTFQKVTKWFGNARHSFRASSALHRTTDAIRTTTLEDYYKKKVNEVFQENNSKDKKEEQAQKHHTAPQKILYEAFQENQYPSKEKKDSLAQELGMTFQQVTKWFGNARHSFRVASNPRKDTDVKRTTTDEDHYKQRLNEVFQENRYPGKEKKEELAQELGVTTEKVSRWFQTARSNLRAPAPESGNPTSPSSGKAEASGSHNLHTGATDKTPGGKADSPRSSTSPRSPRIEPNSPETATSGDSSSGKKGNKAVGSTTPKGRSEKSRDGTGEEDDRQKAIAKELRKMRSGR